MKPSMGNSKEDITKFIEDFTKQLNVKNKNGEETSWEGFVNIHKLAAQVGSPIDKIHPWSFPVTLGKRDKQSILTSARESLTKLNKKSILGG